MRYLYSSLLALLLVAVAIGGQRKEKDDAPNREVSSLNSINAASSPWYPRALELATSTYKSVVLLPGGVIWITGGSSPAATYYGWRSTDGGKSFTKFTFPAATGFANLDAKDANTAVIGLYTGEIIRTTNGGAKWDTVTIDGKKGGYNTPDTAFVDCIRYMNADTVLAFGDADFKGIFVGRSVDGGATFTRLTVPTSTQIYGYATYGACMDVYGKTAWLAAYASGVFPKIFKTTDAGTTWDTVTVPLTGGVANNYYFRSIFFKDDSIGFAVDRAVSSTSTSTGNPNRMHKTTDGGKTWSDTLSIEPGSKSANAIPYTVRPIRGTSHVVGVGFSNATGSKSWWSTDDGTTWTALATPGTTNLTMSAFLGPTVGFAVGFKNVLEYTPSVNVTFLANTAGVPDTLKANSFVQVRGGAGPLTWDKGSPVIMANNVGDYWKASARFKPADTVDFKFFTFAAAAPLAAENEHKGWEGDLSTGNRKLIVGNSDTTLPLQYVNGFKSGAGQYEKPFVVKPASDSTFVMYLRVNMQGFADFNPTLHKVGVRGSNTTDWSKTGELNWDSTTVMVQEPPHANGGSRQYNSAYFYSTAIHVPMKYAGQAAEFKFVVHNISSPNNEDWSKMVANPGPQYHVTLPPVGDTTVYWKWFGDKPFIAGGGKDTAYVTFRTDLSTAIATKGFAPGDTVVVRSGYFGTAQISTKRLIKTGITGNIYQVADTIYGTSIGAGKLLYYQYYLQKYGVELREIYYNFNYTGADPSAAERRTVELTSKTMTALDTSKSITSPNRQPRWQNTAKLAQNVLVTFTVDLRPAFYQVKYGIPGKDTLYDIQGPNNIHKGNLDSLFKWGVHVNGPATGGWATWGTALYGDTTRKMYDNGTHGDKTAGDSIYSRQIMFYKDSVGRNTVGQEFKFGIKGGDNEGGKGGYGNNHIENIDDSQPTATIASQFGSINPAYYDRWDFNNGKPVTAIRELPVEAPLVFSLDQNYPNPFNPATVIRYSIPNEGKVALRIFNLLGQEVATLVNDVQKAGRYEVSFDASRFASGVYFYRVDAGSFSSTKKMLLLK